MKNNLSKIATPIALVAALGLTQASHAIMGGGSTGPYLGRSIHYPESTHGNLHHQLAIILNSYHTDLNELCGVEDRLLEKRECLYRATRILNGYYTDGHAVAELAVSDRDNCGYTRSEPLMRDMSTAIRKMDFDEYKVTEGDFGTQVAWSPEECVMDVVRSGHMSEALWTYIKEGNNKND